MHRDFFSKFGGYLCLSKPNRFLMNIFSLQNTSWNGCYDPPPTGFPLISLASPYYRFSFQAPPSPSGQSIFLQTRNYGFSPHSALELCYGFIISMLICMVMSPNAYLLPRISQPCFDWCLELGQDYPLYCIVFNNVPDFYLLATRS